MQHNGIHPSAPPAEALNCNPELVAVPMYMNPPPPYFSIVDHHQNVKNHNPNLGSAYTLYLTEPHDNGPPVAQAPAPIPVQKSGTTRRSCCCIISTLTIVSVIFILLFCFLNKEYEWWD